MAVPTFFQISPTTGPTRGRRVLQILGSNFQLPPAPPPTGKTTKPNPSVRVLFDVGGRVVASDDVSVLTKGLLHVLSPVQDPGAATITILNVEQNGNVISGEQVVVPGAYTYALPNLNATGANEGLLAYAIRTLLQEMKRQILANTVLTVSVDYDDSPADHANIAVLAKLPGLVLAGPKLRENRLHSVNQLREDAAIDFNAQSQKRPGYTVDLVFTVTGVDDDYQPTANLLQETIGFFHQNRLLVLRNPVNPEQFVEFEMQIEETPGMVGSPNNSNLHAFSGTVAVLGVTLDDEDMAIRSIFPVNDIIVGTGSGFRVEQFFPDDDED